MGLAEKEYFEAVDSFYERQQKYNAVKKKYNKLLADFERDMENAFLSSSSKSLKFTNPVGEGFKVTRTAKVSIEWDVDKLKRQLGRETAKEVVRKKYTIENMQLLSSYLRQFGVEPKIFASFLTIEEEVDNKKLDELSKMGRVAVKDVKGCYNVVPAKAYYTITPLKERGNEPE